MSLNKTEIAIINAARKVFLCKGYSAATMENIASIAKVNKASLHYYFRSKDRLFAIVLTEAFGIIKDKLISIIISDDNLENTINNLIDIYIETLIQHPYLPNFMINEISSNPEKVLKILLGENLSSFAVLRMAVIIRKKLIEANAKDINPLNLILNIASLNVFPFLIRPVITNFFRVSDDQFNSLMKTRKQDLSIFVLNAIKE